VKWRFLDQGEGGWQAAVFPQLETAGSRRHAVMGSPWTSASAVAAGSRQDDWSAQFQFEPATSCPAQPRNAYSAGSPDVRNAAAGTGRELYNDHVMGTSPNITTLDFGGRYKLQRDSFCFHGRSRLGGDSNGQCSSWATSACRYC